MTRSNDAPRDLHLPSRPPVLNGGADMRDDYRGYRTPGWKQLLCAWFIVLTVATLFRIADLITANRTAPFAHATGLAQVADAECRSLSASFDRVMAVHSQTDRQ